MQGKKPVLSLFLFSSGRYDISNRFSHYHQKDELLLIIPDNPRQKASTARRIRTTFRGIRYIPFLFVLLLVQCSSNDDQREFEQKAYQAPNGITETDGNGNLLNNGTVDLDDWRTAPFFEHLLEIHNAFPNPVLTNESVTIQVDLFGIESDLVRIDLLVIDEDGRDQLLSEPFPIEPNINTLTIPAQQLDPGTSPTGLKRIILRDQNANVISYGDIKVN